ncbi:MAG: 2-hydroxychromene-2-carboxylate isomerase [Rhodospirillaceae bacterium]
MPSEPIQAFYGPSSPWAYMGAERLYALADRQNTPLVLQPIRVITDNGGIFLRTRPQPRQDYHAVELARWSKHLGIPLNLQPKFYPCRTIETAAGAMIATQRAGLDARAFSFAIQRALWAEDRDIADVETLKALARETVGNAGAELVADPLTPEIRAIWEGNLAEAQRIGIFGTPTYVYRGELFWGQDRLEFLERAIAESRT